MSVSGIGGAMGGINYYNRVNRNSNQTASSFSTGSCINLKMTDEDSGSKALTCVGFPDGSSASVFKAEGYTDSNPQYMVKHWGKNGEQTEYIVNPTQVNPEDASYIDMLAYSTYLDLTGQTKNGFGDFLTASRGVNGNLTYDAESMNTKKDFKSLVKEFMQAQYNAGNMTGYLSFKRLYDCMEVETKSLQDKEYQKLISEKKNEIYEKLKNGDTEESFQIGGSSFTEKEWDKLLAEVDDITEEMREAMREEHEKRFAEAVKETTSNSTDNVNETDIVSKLFETQNSEIKVSNFKEHETPNYKFVPEPDTGSGGMRILKNGQSVAVFSVDDLKIRVDEQTGTRVLISEMGGFGGAWYDAIPVDAELENGLAKALGVDEIPEVTLEGYYIGTHAGTGIQYVMRPGDEGRGGKVLLRNAVDEAKYNALAEEYYTRYPNLVTSQEAGRIYASFEICGMQERTATGFVNIRYDSISYHDNFDYKKNWSAKLTGDTWDMLWQWLEGNRSRMEKVGEFSTWGNIIDKLGGSYERIWSDEEVKQGYLNN